MKNNIYRQTRFLTSAHRPDQFPADTGSEVAFAGRSNAGKSSVINVITGQKSLARVSKTPGRTQLINFFTVTETVRMVDLPGYGYARVPANMQRHWAGLVNSYLQKRRSLRGVVLITDIRRGLTEVDEMMLEWTVAAQVPLCLLLNKADKLSRGAAGQHLLRIEKELPQKGVQVLLFSALKQTGREQVCAVLDDWLF